jgi:adenylate cyclase
MQQITSCIFDIFPAAERVLILLQDKECRDLRPIVARTRHGLVETPGQATISRSIVREVTTHKRSVLSFDTLDDDRFSEQASVIDLAIRSMMCAPLLVGNEVLGVIQVDTQSLQHGFTSEDLQVLTGISTQAAIAVKNAQLYEMIETETARRTSLQRYFSPKLVEMFMSGDITTSLGGKAYHGTILFSDIIGFTAMSEGMAPADLVAKLNRYFTITQKLIHENGGNVDKFNGDGVMAFWGVPEAGAYDELDALLTALHMQKALWVFNLELEVEHQHPIMMAIGLNSGEFVAGNVGSKDKIEFTLIGDTVNLAARIEQLASRYQVLVPETIWERIKHQVGSVKLPLVRVKGKSAPITVYSIRCVRHPLHEGYSMAIPCSLLDAKGKQAGRGLLTQGQLTKFGPCLRLNTEVPLEQGSVAVLQLVMPEYHKQLLLSARVHRVIPGYHSGGLSYTKAVLTDVQGEEPSDFLRPGGLLTTAYSWDDLKRR